MIINIIEISVFYFLHPLSFPSYTNFTALHFGFHRCCDDKTGKSEKIRACLFVYAEQKITVQNIVHLIRSFFSVINDKGFGMILLAEGLLPVCIHSLNTRRCIRCSDMYAGLGSAHTGETVISRVFRRFESCSAVQTKRCTRYLGYSFLCFVKTPSFLGTFICPDAATGLPVRVRKYIESLAWGRIPYA